MSDVARLSSSKKFVGVKLLQSGLRKIMMFLAKFLNKKNIVHLSLLLILSIVPFLWYGSDLIVGSSFGAMIDPFDELRRHFYSWDSRTLLGRLNDRDVPLIFPYDSLLVFFTMIGTLIAPASSLLLTNRLLLILSLFLPGISMYYLIGAIEQNSCGVGKLIASVAYVYNIEYLVFVHGGSWEEQMAYGALPLMLGFYIRGLNSGNHLKYGVLLGLASLVMSGVDLPRAAINLLVLAIFFFYDLITSKTNILQKTKFFIFVFLVIVLLNMFWIIPALDFTLYGWLEPIWEPAEKHAIASSYVERFRLLGQWGFYSGYKGIAYHSYAHHYISNPFLIFTTLSLPIIALSALLVRPRNRYILFFGILIVISMPMAVGAYPSPTAEVYLWAYENVPYFKVFRDSSKLLTPIVLAYSVMLGFITNKLYKHKWNFRLLAGGNSGKIAIAMIACLILVNSWPAYTGYLFSSTARVRKIPDYWYEAAEWFNAQPGDFRIFILPGQYFAVYNWGHPHRDISITLFKMPQVMEVAGNPGESPHTVNLTILAYKLFTQNLTDSLGKVLSLMNVKYIVQRNDVDWDFYNVDPPERVRSFLTHQKGIYLERGFGQLDFYRNEYVAPYIYAVTGLLYVNGSLDLLLALTSTDKVDFKSPAIFFSEILPEQNGMVLPLATRTLHIINTRPDNYSLQNNEEILFLENPSMKEYSLLGVLRVLSSNSEHSQGVTLTYVRQNPTLYTVRVNAQSPFFFIFSESYDPRWSAYIEGRRLEKHFLINAYANAWYVDETGNFTIVLQYKPQKLRNIGYVISSVALVVLLAMPLLHATKKYTRKTKDSIDAVGKAFGEK